MRSTHCPHGGRLAEMLLSELWLPPRLQETTSTGPRCWLSGIMAFVSGQPLGMCCPHTVWVESEQMCGNALLSLCTITFLPQLGPSLIALSVPSLRCHRLDRHGVLPSAARTVSYGEPARTPYASVQPACQQEGGTDHMRSADLFRPCGCAYHGLRGAFSIGGENSGTEYGQKRAGMTPKNVGEWLARERYDPGC